MRIETMLEDLAHYATPERTVLYNIMWRNAGVGVQWHEEDRCTTPVPSPFGGGNDQVAFLKWSTANSAALSARMSEGLVVYGYHDDLRTALACELTRFIVHVTDGDDEEMRRNTIRDHCLAGAPEWFGRDPEEHLLKRTCIACDGKVVDPDQHSEPRELNYAMTVLCDGCQTRIGL